MLRFEKSCVVPVHTVGTTGLGSLVTSGTDVATAGGAIPSARYRRAFVSAMRRNVRSSNTSCSVSLPAACVFECLPLCVPLSGSTVQSTRYSGCSSWWKTSPSTRRSSAMSPVLEGIGPENVAGTLQERSSFLDCSSAMVLSVCFPSRHVTKNMSFDCSQNTRSPAVCISPMTGVHTQPFLCVEGT